MTKEELIENFEKEMKEKDIGPSNKWLVEVYVMLLKDFKDKYSIEEIKEKLDEIVQKIEAIGL